MDRRLAHESISGIGLPKLPPELALVAACSRWPLGEGEAREIRTSAAARIDWNRFVAWVRRNRIVPLIHHNLVQAACPSVPETVVLQLQGESARNNLRVLTQLAEATRVSRLLADSGIRSMIIKGPVLAQIVFGNPLLRESGDIDVVVDPDRVSEAGRLIVNAGYRRVVPGPGISPAQYATYLHRRSQFGYYLETHDLLLELHWRLTTNPLLMPIDAETLWSRTDPVRVAGANFVTLPDEEMFLYLCVHGSVHVWFRLKWLADIAALLRRLPPNVIDLVAKRAHALGLDRSFHQAIILAYELMAAPVPPGVLAQALADRAARQSSVAACRALNWHGSPEEPIKSQWFSAWVNWHAFGLRPGLRFRWKEFQNQMFSPEDLVRVRLPESLQFLYLPLRPLSWMLRNIQRLLTRS